MDRGLGNHFVADIPEMIHVEDDVNVVTVLA
jgi:hypothetical protein